MMIVVLLLSSMYKLLAGWMVKQLIKMSCGIPYFVKYWRGKILVNGSRCQFAKILPNQSLPLKYFEFRAEVLANYYCQKFGKLVLCHVRCMAILRNVLSLFTIPICRYLLVK